MTMSAFRRLAAVVLFAALVLVAPGPASAGVRERPGTQSGTWFGGVERHAGHLDYVGSPCPVEAEICVDFIARYRLLALNRQAEVGLRRSVGSQVSLTGSLIIRPDGQHQGVLLVSRVG